jgi:hypothetical protein
MPPFVEKEVKDVGKHHQAKAYIYKWYSYLYRDKGKAEDYVHEETWHKKAVESIERSANDTLIAKFYFDYAHMHSTKGRIQIAHDYFYKAIKVYESIGQYDGIASCLYLIAVNLMQTRDAEGLRKVIEQMQQNIEKQSSTMALYNLYSMQCIYYNLLFENYSDIIAFNDSALWASKNTIRLIENHKEELSEYVAISWDYYNLACTYGKACPDNYDSISFYLNKALEVYDPDIDHTGSLYLEINICVYQIYAQLHLDRKNYRQAEKDILHVLSLLEQVKDHNSVVVAYTNAYMSLVKCYEETNRPAEALKYQKLLTENKAKRYDNEKITAMNDMLVKYETEKKKEEIDRLAEQNQTAQKILMLTVGLIAVLLVALSFLIRIYILKKRSFRQTIYESMLLSELKQNELEQNLKEKERLQQQYDKLEKQARLNKQKAESYNEDLMRIKQQLEQKPTKAMIEKLTDWISKSVIKKTKKHAYIQQLSELDIDMLECGYLSANGKISNMDMKYIICFAINMEVQDMSLLFNVDTNSIYTVRYRIKKKFNDKNIFKFLI